MIKFSFSSLRVRLLVLVLLAVVPALGLILYTGAEQRRSAAVEVQENALQLARSVSSSQDDLIEGARQLLTALAQMPFIQGDNPSVCNAVFSKLLKEYKNYANLGVNSLDGDPVCGGLLIPGRFNFADRSWFQGVMQTGDFFIGEYQVGRITRKATLGLGYPVRNEAGRLKAILYAGLDLNWLNTLAAKTQLPSGASLTVIDRKGTIIVRYPDPEKWVGQPMASMPLAKTVLAQGEGVAEAPGVDGLPRLYGFTPLGSGTPAAYVTVGVPKDLAIATANRILVRNLMGVGIVGALAFLAAWFGANFFVLRRVNALRAIAKRLSGGELGARTGLSYGQGELGELARVFDQMAEALQHQQGRLKRSLKELSRLYTALAPLAPAESIHELMEEITERVLRAAGSDAALIRLQDENGLVRVAAQKGFSDEYVQAAILRPGSAVNQVLTTGLCIIASDIAQDHRLKGKFQLQLGLRSCAMLPLKVRGEVRGVIHLASREVGYFKEEQQEHLMAIARQMGIMLENRDLFAEIRDSRDELERANEDLKKQEDIQKLLKELSQDITSLDVDSLLRKLTGKVREFLKVDVADVRVLEGEHWYLRGVSGMDPGAAPAVRPGTAQRRTGWILRNRRPLVVSDITRSQGMRADGTTERLGIRGFLGVPIFSRGGEVIGILRALTHQPRDFTQVEVDLLQQLANGTAIALENARLLEQIKNQAVELEKANKVKDEFLGFVSHELRTPVNAVIGYAAMIQDGLYGEVHGEQRETLGKIMSRSHDLLSMVNGLLEATRIEAGGVRLERNEVNLSEFLGEVRSTYDVRLDKELTFVWDYPSYLSTLETDRDKLKHILQNLINNAIKYTDKGSVSISARIIEGSRTSASSVEPQKAESSQQEGKGLSTANCLLPAEQGYVEFRVTDTGMGIPKESLPSIFEMFRQVKDSKNGSRGGVGLGLHIVKKFTELLGGKVEVESEPGKGTTFTVTIPCADQNAISSRQQAVNS